MILFMKSCTLAKDLVLLSFIGVILVSFISVNPTSFAQQVASNPQTKLTSPKVHNTQPIHRLPDVKISSPLRGQQIPVGSNLTISGTSTSNPATNCQVYIIVGNVKPYQSTVPVGHGGAKDYSAWKYQLKPRYTVIKPGTNEIAAKISCAAKPVNVTDFYSINVTGVVSSSSHLGGQGMSSTTNSTTMYRHSPLPIIILPSEQRSDHDG